MNNKFPILILLTLVVMFVACDDNNDDDISYEVPTTYDFDKVSYSGQTDRLNQTDELSTYIKSANDGTVVLDLQKLTDMFVNTDDNGGGHFSFSSSKQLKNKTFEPQQAIIEDYFEKVVNASQSTSVGSNGQAGSISNGTKEYLFDENGLEYAQLIEKGLMGACFYYQITSVYLSEERVGDAVDNTTIDPNEGTPMEHHWDEAFGYLGVEKDFPTNETTRFLGKYINDRNELLGSADNIMNAFLAGRAAISNNDFEEKNIQRTIIAEELEKAIAGTAIHYLNGAIADFSDDVLRNHQLSEAWAFTDALFYSPDKSFTTSDIEGIKQLIGDNFYEVTTADLTAARTLIAAKVGLESIATQL